MTGCDDGLSGLRVAPELLKKSDASLGLKQTAMAPGRIVGTLVVFVVFAVGGFALVNWWQKPRDPAQGNSYYQSSTDPRVINRLEGCEGFNASIDEAIALQNRIGHPHNSERLRPLKRDCAGEQQEHYRAVAR
jgi:hypothetical protein